MNTPSTTCTSSLLVVEKALPCLYCISFFRFSGSVVENVTKHLKGRKTQERQDGQKPTEKLTGKSSPLIHLLSLRKDAMFL